MSAGSYLEILMGLLIGNLDGKVERDQKARSTF
jgi:hypothetical protein